MVESFMNFWWHDSLSRVVAVFYQEQTHTHEHTRTHARTHKHTHSHCSDHARHKLQSHLLVIPVTDWKSYLVNLTPWQLLTNVPLLQRRETYKLYSSSPPRLGSSSLPEFLPNLSVILQRRQLIFFLTIRPPITHGNHFLFKLSLKNGFYLEFDE
jgi:hypothetical protein